MPFPSTKTVGKTDKEELNKTLLKTIRIIKEEPTITREKMAHILHLSVRGVEYNLKKLRDTKIVERRGGRKSGYWVILQNIVLDD